MTECSEKIDDMKNLGVEATTTGTDCHKSKVCELKIANTYRIDELQVRR